VLYKGHFSHIKPKIRKTLGTTLIIYSRKLVEKYDERMQYE